ncbi:MAG: hypothetical protein ABI333_24910 [bacterium]
MTPRELPDLTIGDRPTMSPELHGGSTQQRSRWLIACSIALLVAAGITASLALQPTKTTTAPRAAVTRPAPDVKHELPPAAKANAKRPSRP